MLKSTIVNQIAGLGIVQRQSQGKVAGRLQYYLSNWKLVTKDRWIWDTITGYKIAFVRTPTQTRAPPPIIMGREETKLVQEELDSLIQKGAVVEPHLALDGGFVSNIFLVPKKDGGQRPVVNLKALNQFVQTDHFKMEGLHTVKQLVRPGDWLIKIDLKDAYFAIPIHHTQTQFLRFQFRGKTYEFRCLPFGLSSAPLVFTKTLKPVVALLRELGVRCVIYIDDILVMAESSAMLRDQSAGVLYLLEALGFTINYEKSIIEPTQELEYLGVVLNTTAMELRLPGEKLKKIRLEAGKIAQGAEPLTARVLARLIGKMNAASQVIPPAPLFYRHLQRALSQALERGNQSYETQLTLSEECREELQWWMTKMSKWNGRTLVKSEFDMTITSDASLWGWGATNGTRKTGGPWSNEERRQHINCLELLAARLALQTFAKNSTRVSILLRLDNSTAVAYINNLGGTVSRELILLTRSLWMWCLERNIQIVAQHLPGSTNKVADEESRTLRDRSDWMLSTQVFDRINHLFGPLEVDLFASRLTSQLPVFYSWRPDPLAKATDALVQDWSRIKGFANPPWVLVGRVLAQVRAQRATIVLVAPVWKAQPWYADLLHMLVDHPRLIHHTPLTSNQGLAPPEPLPQLAVWHISGRNTLVSSYQMRLQTSYSSRGVQRPTNLTTHSSTSGVAGVLNGVQIPFLVL